MVFLCFFTCCVFYILSYNSTLLSSEILLQAQQVFQEVRPHGVIIPNHIQKIAVIMMEQAQEKQEYQHK